MLKASSASRQLISLSSIGAMDDECCDTCDDDDDDDDSPDCVPVLLLVLVMVLGSRRSGRWEGWRIFRSCNGGSSSEGGEFVRASDVSLLRNDIKRGSMVVRIIMHVI